MVDREVRRGVRPYKLNVTGGSRWTAVQTLSAKSATPCFDFRT